MSESEPTKRNEMKRANVEHENVCGDAEAGEEKETKNMKTFENCLCAFRRMAKGKSCWSAGAVAAAADRQKD